MTKKGKRYDSQFKEEIVRLIHEDKRSVASIVDDFGVSEQTVRNWLRKSKDKDDPDKVRIAQLETELKKAKRKMSDQDLTIQILKKVADNLLNQDFTVDKPNAVWVTDITQITTLEGPVYLATVKDIYHKEIVGWALENHMRTELCLTALENAIRRHHPPKSLIHHSDRGSQYCSIDYQEALAKYKMVCSMSRKGNCWDNACAETFFRTIKSERLNHITYKSLKEARQDIFWYIECFYNRKRRYQAIDYLTPTELKQQYYGKIAA